MYYKLHESNGAKVLACCDSELIGKEIEFEGNRIRIREEFYKGEKGSAKKIEEQMLVANSANLMGKQAVGIALRKKLVSENEVIMLGGVPHCQVYFV